MAIARVNIPRKVRTPDCNDWLRQQLTNRPAKLIAKAAGLNPRTAENVKQGRTGLTMASLVTLCQNDPEFRAAFVRFAGGSIEDSPELVAALSRAINQVVGRR